MIPCKVCDYGQLYPAKVYRFSGIVVLIGWILLAPSLFAIGLTLVGAVATVVGGAAPATTTAGAVPDASVKSLREKGVPEDVISKLKAGTALTDEDLEKVNPGRAAPPARGSAHRLDALKEFESLERAESSHLVLSQFFVMKSKFRTKESRFGRPKPIIELEVVNNTESPVSRAYFSGAITTPGRAIPWLEESFNHSIAGGLEPGESAHWTLAPNSLGGWGSVDPKPGMVLSVSVERLDGPGGKVLARREEFTDEQAERLRVLRQGGVGPESTAAGDSGSALEREVLELQQSAAAARLAGSAVRGAGVVMGLGMFACVGISALVSGLLGWLLVMKRKVLLCSGCGAAIDRA